MGSRQRGVGGLLTGGKSVIFPSIGHGSDQKHSSFLLGMLHLVWQVFRQLVSGRHRDQAAQALIPSQVAEHDLRSEITYLVRGPALLAWRKQCTNTGWGRVVWSQHLADDTDCHRHPHSISLPMLNGTWRSKLPCPNGSHVVCHCSSVSVPVYSVRDLYLVLFFPWMFILELMICHERHWAEEIQWGTKETKHKCCLDVIPHYLLTLFF